MQPQVMYVHTANYVGDRNVLLARQEHHKASLILCHNFYEYLRPR